MRVLYLGRSSRRTKPKPIIEGDFLELLSNDWNDYGFETSFPTLCRINGEIIELELLRLLVDGAAISRSHLDELRSNGWDGEFPIPATSYLSVPSEITFYEQLQGALGTDGAIHVAALLRDASYLVHVAEDLAALEIAESTGFKDSLQRERGSVKAYLDGWKILERQSIAVLDLGFRFRDVFDNISTLNLRFQPDSRLPYDVNVLIGANGSGKSRILHQMVEDWIQSSDNRDLGFVCKPNLSQIVVVSYSPFERFPVDLRGHLLQDSDVYRYFGFRGRSVPTGVDKVGHIRLSHEFPKRNAAHALLDCVSDDMRFPLFFVFQRVAVMLPFFRFPGHGASR